MKSSRVFLSVLALFTAGFVRASDYDFKETFSRTGIFEPTGEITLENVDGNIEIRVWDKNEILIEGEKSAKTEEELKLIDLDIDLSASRAGIRVRLPRRPGAFFSGSNIRAAVRFTLTVPANAVLEKVSTVNSSVTLKGLRGSVNVTTVNGAVVAGELGGSAKLATVNGAIRAEFGNVVAQQKLSFATVNGQIVVRLPKASGFELHGSTVNGRVECDFPIELGKGGGRNLSGRIGDARASLKAETVNGRVSIESF